MGPLDAVESFGVLVGVVRIKVGIFHTVFLSCPDHIDREVKISEPCRTEGQKHVSVIRRKTHGHVSGYKEGAGRVAVPVSRERERGHDPNFCWLYGSSILGARSLPWDCARALTAGAEPQRVARPTVAQSQVTHSLCEHKTTLLNLYRKFRVLPTRPRHCPCSRAQEPD